MNHSILGVLQVIAVCGVISSSLYYLLCLWVAAKFIGERRLNGRDIPQLPDPVEPLSGAPSITVLKPLKGIDPQMYASLRSHCLQDYPNYEIIFGLSDRNDPAADSVKRLQLEFPDLEIRLLVTAEAGGANVKVSNLAQMAAQARFDYLVVNDSDIRVEPDYLRRVTFPLNNPKTGMVTCLYRGIADATLGSRLEALGISTDFCPGVLLARQLEGGLRFGLGSTLAFRRADLSKIGGFASFVDYLADDYELGKRIANLGRKVELSDVVVETFLPSYRLRDLLAHQLRWARGVRDSRAGGYLGLIFTFGFFWALLALIASQARLWGWMALAVSLLLRLSVAVVVGKRIVRDDQVLTYGWLIPLRDLVAVGVWIASLGGNTVTWRGDRFRLKHGKLTRIPQ